MKLCGIGYDWQSAVSMCGANSGSVQQMNAEFPIRMNPLLIGQLSVALLVVRVIRRKERRMVVRI